MIRALENTDDLRLYIQTKSDEQMLFPIVDCGAVYMVH